MESSSQEHSLFVVADLHEHPAQQELVGDVSQMQINELAESIEADGLHCPIDILPDGTVLDGHQRLLAVKQLGWTEVPVVVRNDIAEEGEAAERRYIVEASLLRRQLGPLGIARAYRQLKQIETGCPPELLRYGHGQDLRDRLAKRFGKVSGRTLDRWQKLLDTPCEIQDAFESGEITQTVALKVANLRADTQEEIVEKIGSGTPAKEAVADFVKPRRRPQDGSGEGSPIDLYWTLLDHLKRHAAVLERHTADIVGEAFPPSEAAELLGRVLPLFEDLRDREAAIAQANLEDLLAAID